VLSPRPAGEVHDGEYFTPQSRAHSFQRSSSARAPAVQLAIRPPTKKGSRDRQAIIALLQAYRLDEDAVHKLKSSNWEVLR
jgi:hypothetical protein